MRKILFFAAVFTLMFPLSLHSQNEKKVYQDNNVKYSYITPDGKPTDIKPETPKYTPEKERLLKQLMKERLAENTQRRVKFRKDWMRLTAHCQ